MLEELKTRERVVGLKQTLRAVESGRVQQVFLASDADPALLLKLRQSCSERDIPILDRYSMKELGGACGLAVGAAACAALH